MLGEKAVVFSILCLKLTFGYTNVAISKPSWQSSDHDVTRFPASKGNDGDTSSIMHTNTDLSPGWWVVDLKREVQDAGVTVYFRPYQGFTHPNRITGVQLYTSSTKFTTTQPGGNYCTTFNDPTRLVTNVTCAGSWRYLKVYSNTKHGMDKGAGLDFREVEVFGCAEVGSYGIDCSSQCGNCYNATTIRDCHQATGECLDGCQHGWKGAQCTQACENGVTYWRNCARNCSNRHCLNSSVSCDVQTGSCGQERCQAGWRGTDCIEECLAGTTYGPNCEGNCSNRHCLNSSPPCDVQNGSCGADRCRAGWKGTECLEPCENGVTYGRNCEGNCSNRHCRNTSASCDVQNGSCEADRCQAGWKGEDCIEACSNGVLYGRNCEGNCSNRHCLNTSASCDVQTGSCGVERCQAGWNGTDCTQGCEERVSYGRNCVRDCSNRHCLNSTYPCDVQTGSCGTDKCELGWIGDDCYNECTDKYGTECANDCTNRHCLNSLASCDVQTGSCGEERCQAGWRGTDCTQDCLSEIEYGLNCEGNCSNRHCLNLSASCGVQTGSCGTDRCQAGWRGTDCSQSCDETSYGYNCESKCKDRHCLTPTGPCNNQNGTCENGCEANWDGIACTQALKGLTAPPVHPAAIGVPIAVVVVAVIVIVIVIVIKRRRSSNDKPKPTPKLDNEYVNVSVGYQADKTSSRNGGADAKVTIEPQKSNNRPKEKEIKAKVDNQKGDEKEAEEELDEDEEQGSPPPDNEYCNIGDFLREIRVEELDDTIQRLKQGPTGFGAEFKRLPTHFFSEYEESRKAENIPKNKYKGYYPYDNNRVRLQPIPDVPFSDYINASTMHSYNQRKTYIAAQAPNQHTIGDFWRMIWEQGCGRVVMLTGLVEGTRRKCHSYWTDTETFVTDLYTVKVKLTKVRGHYTVRHLRVTSKTTKECRTVVQYHYTSWPDHGVPDILALVNFIWTIRRTDASNDGPLLVHCSAGIGRTGTYIAVDSVLDQAREEGVVDVPGYVCAMREQRKGMIQTKEQYECVFECLLEMTKFGNTSMDVENFTISYSSRGMDSMVDRKTLREIIQLALAEDRKGLPDRNKLWVDGKRELVVRTAHSVTKESGFLLTLAPSQKHERLLWKLVQDHDVRNAVLVSTLESPLHGNKGESKRCDKVTLTTSNQTTLTPDLEKSMLQLMNEGEHWSVDMEVFQFSSPSLDRLSSCLLNIASLQQLTGETTPTLVIYSGDDEKNAHLFCVMCNVLYDIKEENRVDVVGHIRRFLRASPTLQLTEEDITKIHKFACDYIEMVESSKTYANI